MPKFRKYSFLLLAILLLPTPLAVASERYADFSGQAKQFVRGKEYPVYPNFKRVVKKFIQGRKGDCEEFGTQLYLLDLNNDKAPEGLVFYTLEACGGGNNASRRVEIFFQSNGKWEHRGTIFLGSLMVGFSEIVEINNGKIVVRNKREGDVSDATYVFRDGKLDLVVPNGKGGTQP